MDDDFKEISSKFEAVKLRMTHDKNGHVLVLSIHPDNTPEDILRDPLGMRYMIVAVRVNDDGEPVAGKATDDGIRAIRLAAALCSDPEFHMFMASSGYADAPNEESTVEGLRAYLGVKSRSELKTDKEARRRLLDLRAAFADSFAASRRAR